MSTFVTAYLVIAAVVAIGTWGAQAVYFSEESVLMAVVICVSFGLLVSAIVGLLWPLAALVVLIAWVAGALR